MFILQSPRKNYIYSIEFDSAKSKEYEMHRIYYEMKCGHRISFLRCLERHAGNQELDMLLEIADRFLRHPAGVMKKGEITPWEKIYEYGV